MAVWKSFSIRLFLTPSIHFTNFQRGHVLVFKRPARSRSTFARSKSPFPSSSKSDEPSPPDIILQVYSSVKIIFGARHIALRLGEDASKTCASASADF